MKKIYGSLTLSATTPVAEFPQFLDPTTERGLHTASKFRGSYALLVKGRTYGMSIPIPQRSKYLEIYTQSPLSVKISLNLNRMMRKKLAELDSRFDAARHLYKLNQMMIELENEYDKELLKKEQRTAADVLRFFSIVHNSGEHPNISLLSSGLHIDLIGVYDLVNSSVRLVWTTDKSFINDVKAYDFPRYVYYRFPTFRDRPIFLYTQALCSKWLEWHRAFEGPSVVLRCFNALEAFLYKDPSVESYDPHYQHAAEVVGDPETFETDSQE